MGVGAAIAGAGVLSAGTSLLGSSQSSSASKQASALQEQEYAQTRSDLSPYNTTGQGVLGQLSSVATSGPTGGGPNYVSQAAANTPYNVLTQSGLEQTPGYQFIRDQGLKSTLSQNAARGLGVSGAALKGAASYVTGLASNTYQNQFNDAQQQFSDYLSLNTAQQGNLTNQFNRLSNVASLGESAAAQTGVTGAQLSNAAGSYLQSAGQAQGAGTVSAGNALSNAANQYAGYNYWQGLSGGTGGYTNAAGTTGTLNYTPSNMFSGGPVLSDQSYVSN